MKQLPKTGLLVAVVVSLLATTASSQSRPEYWRDVRVKDGGVENFHGILYLDLVGKPIFTSDSTACIVKVEVRVENRQKRAVFDSTAVYWHKKDGEQLEIFGVGLLSQLKPEQKNFGPDDIEWLIQRITSISVIPKPKPKITPPPPVKPSSQGERRT